MKPRHLVPIGLLAGSAVLVTLVFIGPAAASVFELAEPAQWHEAAPGPRWLTLLARGLRIAGGAALLAQGLGGCLAVGLSAPSGSRRQGWAVWVGLVVLLTPPYLYAYAWSLVLLPGGSSFGAPGALRFPAWLAHEGRAVWCLGTWTAPLSAAVLALGWAAAGRPAYRLALLDGSRGQALRRVVTAAMRPWITLGLLLCGLLALTEHTVCDLSQAPTWNTELLARLQSSNVPGLLLAWPLGLIVLLAMVALWPCRARLRLLLDSLGGWRAAEEAVSAGGPGGRSGGWLLAAASVLLLLPWGILALSWRDPAAFARTWQSFPQAWPHSLRYAGGATLVSMWLAVGADWLLFRFGGNWERRRSVRMRKSVRVLTHGLLVLAVGGALLPPALVGDAFAAAYWRWPWLSDRWWIVSLVTAARFAVIAWLCLRLSGRPGAEEDLDSAAVDGAEPWTAYCQVRLPSARRGLVAGALLVGVLALTEVPASHMVCPAGVESVALRLFNHIHYGRNDEIIALSLYLMAFLGLVVTLARRVLVRPDHVDRTADR